MNSLVLMYVYFDKNGTVKAISPVPQPMFDGTFTSAMFPMSEVEDFLKSKKSISNYYVKKVGKLTSENYKLVRKSLNVSYTRTLDNYLTKVEDSNPATDIVKIVNDPNYKVVSIELSRDFIDLYTDGTEDDTDTVTHFINRGYSSVYLTKKDNPYHLLFSFTFSTKQLFEEGKLYFNCDKEFVGTSAYTKKLISGYGFREKKYDI